METPDTRTHGAAPAINDEAPAARPFPAYEQFDAVDPIPGAEAIPADLPNAQPGDVSLPYDLQTFNALVAANTAMQTEISSLNEKAALIEQQRDSFKEALDEERANTKVYLTQIKDLQQHDRDRQKAHGEKLEAALADLQFANDQRDVLQRRLDRALGYLDRVMDDEDSRQPPEFTTEQVGKPAVGPAIGQIPDAVRPDTARQAHRDYFSAFPGEPIRHRDFRFERPRRY